MMSNLTQAQRSSVYAVFEIIAQPAILGEPMRKHVHTCTSEESCLMFLQQLDNRKASYEVQELPFEKAEVTRIDQKTAKGLIKMRETLRHPEKIDTCLDEALLGIELQNMFKETFGE